MLKAFAVLFAILGAPLLVSWFHGDFVIFWTASGAALVQLWGSAIACLFADWLLSEKHGPAA